MTVSGALSNQIANRNFLAPVGFKFSLSKFPKVTFFSNTARIPDLTLGTAIQSTYLKDIDIPGEKLTFGDLNVRFLVDENLENYMKIHNWLTGLGFPESAQEFINKTTDKDGLRDVKNQFSDGSLHILNSNFKDIAVVKFKDLFPTYLTSLEFDATESDINFFTADVTFKYTIYDILSPSGTPL
mgnify:CR=1 FL=1|tara:strand:- start:1298 stop:1849 length:552 start_codon:yes stop_codon:yes gene_type:complete